MKTNIILMLLLVLSCLCVLCACKKDTPDDADTAGDAWESVTDDVPDEADEDSVEDKVEEPETVAEPQREEVNLGAEPFDEAGCLYATEDDTWIECTNGDVYSYAAGDFDCILFYGGGYYALYRDSSDFDNEVLESGILSSDGTWVYEYGEVDWTIYSIEFYDYVSVSHISIEQLLAKSIIKYPIFNEQLHKLDYMGEGVFYLRDPNNNDWILSMVTGTILQGKIINIVGLDDLGQVIQQFIQENYAAVGYKEDGWEDYHALIISPHEVIADLGEFDWINVCSDGGFVYSQDGVLYFFDCEKNESALLCDDPRFSDCDDGFVNGELEIRLTGADEKTYYATIDKQGNYIEEPHLAE